MLAVLTVATGGTRLHGHPIAGFEVLHLGSDFGSFRRVNAQPSGARNWASGGIISGGRNSIKQQHAGQIPLASRN